MTDSATEAAALKEALSPFFSMLPHVAEPADLEFAFSSFRYLSEPIVAVGLRRTLDFLVARSKENGPTNADTTCSITRIEKSDEAGVTEKHQINIGETNWTITSAPRQERASDVDKGIRLIELHRIDGDSCPERLASSTVIPRDKRENAEMGFCRTENFYEFIEFMDAVRPAMAAHLENLEPLVPADHSKLSLSTLSALDQYKLVDLDGGLPGALCRKAAHTIFEFGSRKICEFTASILQSVVEEAFRREIVWGKSFLEYNDLDNNVAAIPSEKPGRSALFHRNSALIFDHNAFVVWTDRDDDGELLEFGVAAIPREDNAIRKAVEAVSKGEAPSDLPLLRFHPEYSEFEHETFFATGLMTSIAHYVTYDFEELVEGNMDRSEDSAVITDFSKIFFGSDIEFEEDNLPKP
jgi:hypothetical protein